MSTVKDVVCGMDIDLNTASSQIEYQGKNNLPRQVHGRAAEVRFPVAVILAQVRRPHPANWSGREGAAQGFEQAREALRLGDLGAFEAATDVLTACCPPAV